MAALSRLIAPLALLLTLGPACARETAVAQGAPTPAKPPAPAAPPTVPAARAVVRAFAPAASETIRLSPSLAEEQENPQPTVDYASLDAARDSIGVMLRRCVNPADSAVRVSMGPARFKYWYAADSVDGWAFHIVVTDTSECPNERVQNALTVAGWVPFYGYSADGPDGGILGLVSKRFLCVVEGQWDGGDDSDSTYVPAPGCEVTVTCVPRREDDVLK
jgi:hypothetical protein